MHQVSAQQYYKINISFTGGFIGIDVTSRQRFYVFDGFASKLTWRDSTTSISASIEGVAGEQVFKVQWKNMGMIGNPAGDFANLQMWFNEKDNSFEVHVGPNHVTGQAAYFSNSSCTIHSLRLLRTERSITTARPSIAEHFLLVSTT